MTLVCSEVVHASDFFGGPKLLHPQADVRKRGDVTQLPSLYPNTEGLNQIPLNWMHNSPSGSMDRTKPGELAYQGYGVLNQDGKGSFGPLHGPVEGIAFHRSPPSQPDQAQK